MVYNCKGNLIMTNKIKTMNQETNKHPSVIILTKANHPDKDNLGEIFLLSFFFLMLFVFGSFFSIPYFFGKL